MARGALTRLCSVLGIAIAIGCGGGKPQDAAATAEPNPRRTESPKQLAQATPGSVPAGAAGSSTIRGTVRCSGATSTQERIKMDADPQCLLQHQEPVTKQEVVVNANGTLRHVFVYVKQGLEDRTFPTPTGPAVLDQHGCMYVPHVFGIQVKQPLEILNSDPTLHNVNCKPTNSKPFNIAQPVKGMKTVKTFTAPEIMVKCTCNVHPWMATYIGVVAHPYFSVTDEEGAFTLANLPAGQYTIEAWHEKYGTQTQTVAVTDGETAECQFAYQAQ